MRKICSENLVILVDFDGTITTVDTYIKVMQMYGNENLLKFEKQFKNKGIDYLTLQNLQFREIRLTEEEYTEFIRTKFDMTEGFLEFYNSIKKNNILFAIVSGGYYNAIVPFLKEHGIYNTDIYANTLVFNNDNISIEFYDKETNDNCCGYGPCGNCKVRHYKNYKKNDNTVIFIGDGLSDYCVSEIADVVFAKGSLLNYCKENNIDYISWQDFNDIKEIIFNTN